MGSRIKEKPDRLFEVFMEVAKPDGPGEVPFVVQQFPEDYEDKEALNMIPKFAFPCETDASKVDHFSFALVDVDSMFRFGYCRHNTGHQTCLCIVSWLPWCEIFYKMLDLLAELTNRQELNQVKDFLVAAYEHEVPASKVPVTIVANEEMFNFSAPDPNILPSIPGSRNLTEYYNAVDTANMMQIFASMLQERRVYMTSKKLSRLTSCVFAAEALLYPMHWQHIFIPVLPAYLIEYLRFFKFVFSILCLHQFICGRLEILNAGIGFRDIFEQQATFYADKLNSQSRYEKWLEMAKKKSKNGFMGVKVKLKEQSKKAMTKISGLTDYDSKGSNFKPTGGIVHTRIRSRPESLADGSGQNSERPPRPPPPSGQDKKNSLSRPPSTSQRNSSEKEESHDDSQLRLSYHTMDMSLMGDSDIQAAMLRSASAEVLPSEVSV
ncbi:DENN domain-containing protein 1B [Elysia marginata]|uniref:DENN domain-containing protein 1B n=1 Tax=Elysia marginata TaxID=1093978 RepID=A0AAV4EFB1_9GAST|nr:DENN domain-containing protein 1B [Elysia marginata]